MLGYKLNHREFGFRVRGQTDSDRILIKRVATAALFARLGDRVVPLVQTPQYQLLAGEPRAYLSHLNGEGKAGAAKSISALDTLLDGSAGYLAGEYQDDYILCELKGDSCVVIDGIHRAAVLLHAQVESIPVAIQRNESQALPTQLEQYLFDYKDDFLEWYTPLRVGGQTINERTYPQFVERPEYLVNRERGQSKFDYIIAKNLPDLRGKTVCDVGCSVGLLAYNLIKLGAASVDGFDRSESIVQPTNIRLPKQSVVQQAYFVKNLLQLQDGKRYDGLQFHEADIAKIDFSAFRYDVFFSCCVLYHFGPLFETIIRDISGHTREIFLQANLGHSGPLGEFASVAYHRRLLEKYGYQVHIDAPAGYPYPVISGRK
jgi:SAM-dependent methyltransferase